MIGQEKATVVWFRHDLRLADHDGLTAACQRGQPVLPIYIWQEEGTRKGGAARVWLHQSLCKLDAALKSRGSKISFFKGTTLRVVSGILDDVKPGALYFHSCPEPTQRKVDEEVCALAIERGVEVRVFNGEGLKSTEEYRNKNTGRPYKVFTPFYKANLISFVPSAPLPVPERIPGPPSGPGDIGVCLDDLGIYPQHPWAEKIKEEWVPGEDCGLKRLEEWKLRVRQYKDTRDLLHEGATSQLSPHLAFGEVSPRQIWHKLVDNPAAEAYLRQICWREFGRMLLEEFPHTEFDPLVPSWKDFEWSDNREHLVAWQKGKTGYPIVDAAMRNLWATGWMPNRTRMIVGSFLVKDLRISWTEGAAWFWDTLVDADLGNNTMGWQWIGGCGADAAPYFRVFNPILQSKKFDAEGAYIRKWVPELADLPTKFIHTPWEAPASILKKAKVQLGRNYPGPMVDHAQARKEALAYYDKIKGKK